MIDTDPAPIARSGALADLHTVDRGLQRFLQGVFAKVAGGLVLAGGLGHLIASTPLRDLLFRMRAEGAHDPVGLTGAGLLVAISPLIALALFGGVPQTRRRSALLFWSVAATMGGASGAVLLAFTGVSIATTFAGAAAGFGALALFGYTTRRNLDPAGAFLSAGLVGLIVALGLNLVLASPAVTFAVNTLGVFIFAGLIAHDMQRLKLIYGHAAAEDADLVVASNVGALCLFLDFANLFQFLLAFTGGRR
jgi:FtsH-binding integral membrane protein